MSTIEFTNSSKKNKDRVKLLGMYIERRLDIYYQT